MKVKFHLVDMGVIHMLKVNWGRPARPCPVPPGRDSPDTSRHVPAPKRKQSRDAASLLAPGRRCAVWGVGFGVQGVGFRGLGYGVTGPGFRFHNFRWIVKLSGGGLGTFSLDSGVEGRGCRVWGLALQGRGGRIGRFEGLGYRVWGTWFRARRSAGYRV